MERYDYYEAVKKDTVDFLRKNLDLKSFDCFNDLGGYITGLWAEEGITGYMYFGRVDSEEEAEENLCHNWNLVRKAMTFYGMDDVDYDVFFNMQPHEIDFNVRAYVYSEMVVPEILGKTENEYYRITGKED